MGKNRAELQLERFTKSIMQTITKVSLKSKAQSEISEILELSSIIENEPISPIKTVTTLGRRVSLITSPGVEKEFKELSATHQKMKTDFEKEIESLRNQLADQKSVVNVLRRDCMKEIQTLRTALLLSGEVLKPQKHGSFKMALNIHYFNELKGCD